MSVKLTRGALLTAAAAAAGAAAVESLQPWRALVTVTPARPAARLTGLLGDRMSAARIGRAYLSVTPAEADADVLIARIAEAAPGGAAAVESASSDELRALLLAAARRDYDAGRLVRVDGWLLAASECRLCALAALAA
ncbi:MAG TPA: hypothetical protein VFV62_06685 [Gaiellaceae bacterium]|nr:hypothetical protein [Gaiellaceae bacterium]